MSKLLKTYTKTKLSLVLWVLLLCSNLACRRNRIEVSTDLILGEWLRVESDKPEYNGMVLILTDSAGIGQGRIAQLAQPNAYFQIGQIKWQDIQAARDSSFRFQALGSDGLYYPAEMRLELRPNSQTLFVQIQTEFLVYGQRQVWTKR